MDNTDNYLLLLIGVLLVSLISVELIPLPEAAAAPTLTNPEPSAPGYKPPKFGTATLTSVRILMPTSTLATVTVS